MTLNIKNLEEFCQKLEALGKKEYAKIDIEDFTFQRRLDFLNNGFFILGYLTIFISCLSFAAKNNIVATIAVITAILAIAITRSLNWTISAHHKSHGSLDRVPNISDRHKSSVFAISWWRRFWDWNEWIIPKAWDLEHNIIHHNYTGEDLDPDLVELNMAELRDSKMPKILKYLVLFASMCTWKFTYYNHNTYWMLYNGPHHKKDHINPVQLLIIKLTLGKKKYQEILQDESIVNHINHTRIKNKDPEHLLSLIKHSDRHSKKFFKGLFIKSYLPMLVKDLILLPLIFAIFFGYGGYFIAVSIILLAEILNNIYSFILIVPNHAGDDLYKFSGEVKHKQEFFLRGILGSANFTTGN